VISLLTAAFFSGMEAAYVASDKVRLELDKQSGAFHSGFLRIITRKRSLFFTTLLFGYYFSLVVFCMASDRIAGSLFTAWIGPSWVEPVIEILAATILFLIVGEHIPQILFRLHPNFLFNLLSMPLFLFYLVLSPFSRFTEFFIGLILKLRPKRRADLQKDESRVFTMIDLDHFLGDEAKDKVIPEEKVEKEVILFRNVLDFSKVKLHEIMVPRNEIAVLDIDSDIETLRRKFVETGFSRILFYEGNKDNIVGYVHTSAIFQRAKSIKPFLKNVLIVHETMAANKLLSKFIREHRSIALVVDEFGGTAGLVTIEDILEEIFGEIEDEYDKIDFTDRKISDRQFVLSGRMEIDDLNEKYNLNIPESADYETLAGFILVHHDSIPKVNTTVRIGKMSFKILKATLTKIELVYLTIQND